MKNIFTFLTNNKNESILAFDPEFVVECNEENCLEKATDFIQKHSDDYRFGFLSYDLKNEVEDLVSENPDCIQFPKVGFFVPRYVVKWDENEKQIFLKGKEDHVALEFIADFLSQKERQTINKVELTPGLTKVEYISKIEKLQEEIQLGNIYEVTFCQEFYAKNCKIEPLSTYFALNNATKSTFSCFMEWEGRYLLSASPERFLKREGNQLITQPIKGTAKRGATPEEDLQLKTDLLASEKERAENIMIVDLVRNDLSRIAERNSVQVDELLGAYTFETVHQLISTVSATINEKVTILEILKALFPMGSMTGAPKISAMELIESHETFKRGLYSGSVGYFKPNGDFDFNVIIRSILYNEKTQNISCPVGGAITLKSSPEMEYEECLVKVNALKKILYSND
ncbi:MAG TPA: anthranilate synthase component I family protein [Brumimicrobium sp.]|nr:anthranilate synthase component I family protein [Brumimicrobium sp.]